jgi:hypothetical protein
MYCSIQASRELTCVQALCDSGGINEVASTQLARDMLVDITHSHCVLIRKVCEIYEWQL